MLKIGNRNWKSEKFFTENFSWLRFLKMRMMKIDSLLQKGWDIFGIKQKDKNLLMYIHERGNFQRRVLFFFIKKNRKKEKILEKENMRERGCVWLTINVIVGVILSPLSRQYVRIFFLWVTHHQKFHVLQKDFLSKYIIHHRNKNLFTTILVRYK